MLVGVALGRVRSVGRQEKHASASCLLSNRWAADSSPFRRNSTTAKLTTQMAHPKKIFIIYFHQTALKDKMPVLNAIYKKLGHKKIMKQVR